MNTWLLLFFLTFTSGQLTRFQLAPAVWIYLQDIFILFLSLASLIKLCKQKKFFNYNLSRPLLAFALAGLLSLLAGSFFVNLSDLLVASLYFIRWLAYAGLYFYFSGIKHQRLKIKLKSLSLNLNQIFLFSGLAMAVLGLLQYFFLPDTRSLKLFGWDDHYYRLIGVLFDPGFTGIIMVFLVFLALGIGKSFTQKLLTAGIPLLALFLTYSRTSYLALLAGVMTYIFLKKKYKLGTGLIIAFFIALFFLPKFNSEGTNLLRTYSLFDRVETWNQGFKIYSKSPILGVGFNTLRYLKKDLGYLDENWLASHSASGIENSYFFVLATTGILGLSAYLWLIAKSFHKINKSPLHKDGFPSWGKLASLTAVCVHSFFLNTLFYPWVMVWFWFLLADN